jgi:hypothetical protein
MKMIKNNIINEISLRVQTITKNPIDMDNWVLFKISNLFEVECSKYHSPDKYKHGNIPYVARTTYNNGVVKFVSTCDSLYNGNCIIIGAESAQAFYQEKPFITGNKVYRIYEKGNSKLNKYIALFLCTILNEEGKKYSYANAWVSDKVKETEIKLPAIKNLNDEYEPNWQYMENYIKEIENKILL